MNTSSPMSIYSFPGNWKDIGNPTPGELIKTFRAVEELIRRNEEALGQRGSDEEACIENIETCKRLLSALYDCLVVA